MTQVRDGVSLLTAYLVVLFALPSRLTVSELGGAGSPATIIGMLLACGWAFHHLHRGPLYPRLSHPVRRALVFLVFAYAVSYVFAMTRAIEIEEVSTADLGLLMLVSWSGVLLFSHDCVPNGARLQTLLRRMTAGGAAVAAVGLAQYVSGQQLIDRISVPGLSLNSSFGGLSTREGYYRPFGTALHPIEFGAVATSLLPLALGLALSDTSRSWVRRYTPFFLLASAVAVSVSRSTLVCAGIGLLCLLPAIPRHLYLRLLGGLVAGAAAVFLLVPGMLGTMLGLFTTAASDSSVTSRTGSYGLAASFFAHSPLFGRGFGTFLPRYRIFDNQYLLSLIEVGAVGLLATLALPAAAIYVARRARQRAPGLRERLEMQGLVGGVVAGAVGLSMFDGLSFPMSSSLLFLLIGVTGAAYRLQRRGVDPTADPIRHVALEGGTRA